MASQQDVEAYASFLQEDKGIPRDLALACGAFMLCAASLKLVQKPKIWAPADHLLGVTKARVYFQAWSQNKMSAIRWHQGYYFCAEQRTVFAMFELTSERWQVLEKRFKREWYSGASTREAVEDAREAVRCLKSQLAAMC